MFYETIKDIKYELWISTMEGWCYKCILITLLQYCTHSWSQKNTSCTCAWEKFVAKQVKRISCSIISALTYHKYNTMAVFIIMFPQASVPSLSRHIKGIKLQCFSGERFNSEANSGNNIITLCFSWLQVIYYGSFS